MVRSGTRRRSVPAKREEKGREGEEKRKRKGIEKADWTGLDWFELRREERI